MSRRRPYRDRGRDPITDATTELFKGRRVQQGWQRYVTTGSVEDEDSAPTTIAFGIVLESEEFIPLEEEPSPQAGITYHVDKTHRLNPGERPAFRIEGGTLTDDIEWYLEGYEERVE